MVAAPETNVSEAPVNAPEVPVPTSTTESTVEVTPEVPETPATKESATELLNLGKRNLFCGNVSEAVNNLSEACAQFDKVFGEQKPECALGYYWYGNALLELARVETDVLGNAMKGIPTSPGRVTEDKDSGVVVEDPDKLTEDEKAEVEQQVSEALDTLAPAEETEAAGEGEDSAEEGMEGEDSAEETGETEETEDDKDEKSEEKNEDSEKTEAMDTDKTTDAATEEATEGDAKDDEVKDEGDSVLSDADTTDDEEDDSLKLAWEMLEMARNVYQAETCTLDDKQEMLSRCFLKLGEVLMETGHHEDADVEFNKSLEIQLNVLTRCDRAIGEAYFVAGLNMMHFKGFAKSKEYLEKAIDAIKQKQISLTTKKESLAADSSELPDVENELKELADLLPNMQEKLQDAETQLKEGPKSGSEDTSMKTNEASGDAKAKDIGHLVKRKATDDKMTNGESECESHKRKAEDAEPKAVSDDVSDAKKAKLAAATTDAEKPVEC